MGTLAMTRKAAPVDDDRRWAAVTLRDAGADGTFWYSVKTTGVYCRPSCPSRRPRRENVAFHADRASAERAGFRPCKRCRPGQPSLSQRHADIVARACRAIETAEEPPALASLAKNAAMSPFHFHRVFKAVAGVTPKAYATAHRARRAREKLTRGGPVTRAVFDAGFNSSGRFYESANQLLGMTPTRFRSGGAGTEIRFAVGQCSLGAILVAQSDRGICAILLGEDPDALLRDLQDRFPRATLVGGDRKFERLVARVVGFIEKPGLGLDLPLDIRGTAFQQRVWQALRKIPAGEVRSYTDVAKKIGAPKSVRAVAQACAANALAVAIPCHRVVRSDGALSGYRWGIERKRTLLAREGRG